MVQARYGIDAPNLVRGFLLAGIGSGAAGFGLLVWADLKPSAPWVVGLLLVVSAYALGMFGLMLRGSLVTKVRGRDNILDLINWTGRERVLDVGCGRGLLLVGAAHRLTTGHATGIDIWLQRDQSSNEMAAPLENAKVEGVADRVSVETGDMRKLPFSDGSFDVVVSSWAVHNLEREADRDRALAEMVRVLRPGGSILLNDIANRGEYEMELRRLGLRNVRVVVESRWRDITLSPVSFGSFRPATIVGHDRRPIESTS